MQRNQKPDKVGILQDEIFIPIAALGALMPVFSFGDSIDTKDLDGKTRTYCGGVEATRTRTRSRAKAYLRCEREGPRMSRDSGKESAGYIELDLARSISF